MEQNSNNIESVVILFAVIASVFLGIKYLRYWQQLQKAMLENKMEWPLNSQKELNETAQKDLVAGYGMIGRNMKHATLILFTMKTDNPSVRKPLNGMRRSVILFLSLPFLAAFVLITVYAFQAV